MFKVAAVFSDHMILQRGKNVCIFGQAEPGMKVAAEFMRGSTASAGGVIKANTGNGMAAHGTIKAEAVTDVSGNWQLVLPAMEGGSDCSMKLICGNESRVFTDIALGEVFLAGGQSNMELELCNCAEAEEVFSRYNSMSADGNETVNEAILSGKGRSENGQPGSIQPENGQPGSAVRSDNKADIRFYYTQKRAYFDEHFCEDEANTGWSRTGGEAMRHWSAVGFFFAEKLAEELDCPIGLIGCNWGGTSASCWMSREAILENENTRIYVDEYDNSPYVSMPREQQIAEYAAYEKRQVQWDKDSAELYATVPGISFAEVESRLGRCEYPGPLTCASFTRAAGLYETMLQRVCPYTLRGFIYYQGESDDHRPDSYYELFTRMVKQWRDDWGEKLPFLFVQLPMHRYEADPDYKHWCKIREAQMRASKDLDNMALAVAIDQGEFNQIHPRYKRRVGNRLALQALSSIYGLVQDSEANAPMPAKISRLEDGTIKVSFANAADGLIVTERLYGERVFDGTGLSPNADKAIIGFETADMDGSFYEAEAMIDSSDRASVLIKCNHPGTVKAIRYLWTNYSEVNLYALRGEGEEPMPVAPFNIATGLQ